MPRADFPDAAAGSPHAMIVIRRMVDRRRAYTAIFLPGEPPKIFPTSDHEHARVLQIYLQDRPYPGVFNDFSEFLPEPAASAPPRQEKPATKTVAGRKKNRAPAPS